MIELPYEDTGRIKTEDYSQYVLFCWFFLGLYVS